MNLVTEEDEKAIKRFGKEQAAEELERKRREEEEAREEGE